MCFFEKESSHAGDRELVLVCAMPVSVLVCSYSYLTQALPGALASLRASVALMLDWTTTNVLLKREKDTKQRAADKAKRASAAAAQTAAFGKTPAPAHHQTSEDVDSFSTTLSARSPRSNNVLVVHRALSGDQLEWCDDDELTACTALTTTTQRSLNPFVEQGRKDSLSPLASFASLPLVASARVASARIARAAQACVLSSSSSPASQQPHDRALEMARSSSSFHSHTQQPNDLPASLLRPAESVSPRGGGTRCERCRGCSAPWSLRRRGFTL